MLPASALNALRRDALEALLRERSTVLPHRARPFAFPAIPEHTAPEEPVLWARFASAGQVVCPEHFARLILPSAAIGTRELEQYGEKLIAELPAVLFPEDEDAFGGHLASLRDAGLRQVLTDNVYGITLAHRLGLKVHGGFGLNIANTQALAFYAEQGLSSAVVSFELSMERIRALSGSLARGVMAYGYLPLMRLRACPLRSANGCTCGGAPYLTDRRGVRFPMECAQKRYSTLLNSVPLHIAERNMRGLDYLVLYFTIESPKECLQVIGEFKTRQKSTRPRTGGLYYRELL